MSVFIYDTGKYRDSAVIAALVLAGQVHTQHIDKDK
jgi:hypothetical protein